MDGVKHTVDATAAVTALASFMHWMPDVAALLTAVWYVIRLVEWARKKSKKLKDAP